MRRAVVAFCGAWLVAASSHAGITYTATLEVDNQLAGGADSSKVLVWIADGKAKAEYVETSIPGIAPGDVLLTRDGGASASLLRLAEKTVAPCRVDGVLGFLSSADADGRGLTRQAIADVTAELVARTEGEYVAGRPTVRYIFRVSYLTTRPSARGDMVRTTVIDQEVWVAEELEGVTPGSWPLPLPLRIGRPEVDEVLARTVVWPKGVPLKAITTRTVTSSEGQERVAHSRFEVLELKVGDVPTEVFAVPEGFREGELRAGAFPGPGFRGKQRPPGGSRPEHLPLP